jgi:NAD(P)H-dependent FMN reductase
MKTIVFYGSVRGTRQGIKAARFIVHKLKEKGHDVDLYDAMEVDLPMLDKRYIDYEKGKAPKKLEEMAKKIESADGFVLVTAEYNHSPPPGLKNMLDHFGEEFYFKPSAIVSYSSGPFGGVRAAVHMRVIAGELGMPSIPSMFPISNVQDSFDEDGKAIDKAYDRRVQKFLDE